MARTRSVAALAAKSVSSKAGATVTSAVKIKRIFNEKKELQEPNLTRNASSLKKQKPHIESAYAHIKIPSDLALPQSFVDSHTPEFIDGVRHLLSIDSSLYPCIISESFRVFDNSEEPAKSGTSLITHYWFSLITSVLGQQISGHAAKAIRNRFELLFDGEPTPEKTLRLPPETVKGVGLSNLKLNYVLSISETFAKGDSNLSRPEFYENATTEELIRELTLLKGVGEWSARMFCLFTLKEMDVFAYDDLGVARGVARYLEIRPQVLAETKKGVHAIEELKARLKRKGKFASANSKRDWTPLHDEYVKFLGMKFLPYQLVFMLLMWRLSSTNTEVLQK